MCPACTASGHRDVEGPTNPQFLQQAISTGLNILFSVWMYQNGKNRCHYSCMLSTLEKPFCYHREEEGLVVVVLLQSKLISFRQKHLCHHSVGHSTRHLSKRDKSFLATELLHPVSCWSVTLTTSENEVTGQVPLSVGRHPTLTSC